jgi:hypothetical protein
VTKEKPVFDFGQNLGGFDFGQNLGGADWLVTTSSIQNAVTYTTGNAYIGPVGPYHYQNIQVASSSLMGHAYQIQYQYQALNPMSTIYWQPPETPQEKAEREKRQAARKAAETRAERLLFTILTPSQVKQYTDDRFFDVTIPATGRIYRLRHGRSMNVELIEAGKPKIKFCAHPHNAYEVPVPDVLLSQLLMLKSSEQAFLQIANRQVIQ